MFDIHLKDYNISQNHDDVIKTKDLPCYWPFVSRIHRSPVASPYRGEWRGTLIFSLICAWTNGCANNRDAGDLRRHRAHYDVTVMVNTNSLYRWIDNDVYWKYITLYKQMTIMKLTTMIMMIIMWGLYIYNVISDMYIWCSKCQNVAHLNSWSSIATQIFT